MRLIRTILAVCLFAVAGLASATNYTLWINGRTGGGTIGDYNSFTYWGPSSTAAGVNKKAVNWDGYNSIASQSGHIRDALDCFCTGNNWCYIATHSAGDLIMGYVLANYGGSARMKKNAVANSSGVCGNADGSSQTGWNIKWVRAASGAGGGSELADYGSWAVSDPLTQDLKTATARAMYNHSSGGVSGSSGGSYCNPSDWLCNDLTLGTAANEGGAAKWSYHSVPFRDDNEAYNHYTSGNWAGTVSVVRSAMVNSAL
ncbi:hypothetical protein AB4Z32_20305 [Massilia sp. 2TAF26]|uniref:hypothetical protein n=1 Tax=Massilia sp. 2TAF26 TaxID=3233012 RepID=UPI003F9454C5